MHRFYQRDSEEAAVVAYGGASFNLSMRGNAPAPNARIARGLERLAHAKVVYTDEFRTSKLCSVCHHQLKPLQENSPPNAHHGVLQCSNSSCRAHGKPWNRDVNATINIASALLHSIWSIGDIFKRPEPFQRGTKLMMNPSTPSFEWFDQEAFYLTSHLN